MEGIQGKEKEVEKTERKEEEMESEEIGAEKPEVVVQHKSWIPPTQLPESVQKQTLVIPPPRPVHPLRDPSKERFNIRDLLPHSKDVDLPDVAQGPFLKTGDLDAIHAFFLREYARHPRSYGLKPADPTDPYDRRMPDDERRAKYPRRTVDQGSPYPDISYYLDLGSTMPWLSSESGRKRQRRDIRRVCFLGSDSEDEDGEDEYTPQVVKQAAQIQQLLTKAYEDATVYPEVDDSVSIAVIEGQAFEGMDPEVVKSWRGVVDASEAQEAADQVLFSIPVSAGGVHWRLGEDKLYAHRINPLGVLREDADAQMRRIAALTRDRIVSTQRFNFLVSVHFHDLTPDHP